MLLQILTTEHKNMYAYQRKQTFRTKKRNTKHIICKGKESIIKKSLIKSPLKIKVFQLNPIEDCELANLNVTNTIKWSNLTDWVALDNLLIPISYSFSEYKNKTMSTA